MTRRNVLQTAFTLLFVLCVGFGAAQAQTTTFTYQGRLTDQNMAAAGTFDFEFRLFDEAGMQIGTTQMREDVAVTDGIFTVQLDFGAAAFPGANRTLEIAVRRGNETGAFTTLAPRQPVTSTPYAVRALNAANATSLDGTAASEFVQTNDARLSDARPPTAGSGNYIQNTTTPQTADFNITGSGTANIFNAGVQYNINGSRVLSVAGSSNLFAGISAGAANPTGGSNSFFGASAGQANTEGGNNSFFGTNAGSNNTEGSENSFVGRDAGRNNTTGSSNSFFGRGAGQANTTGEFNSFVGRNVGIRNTEGFQNSFFGTFAGNSNTMGSENSFFGRSAGLNNTTGSSNTIIGNGANVGLSNLTFATAIGAFAIVRTINTIALGRENGSDKVRVFGLGAAGSTQLCRNANNEISTCSSSLRYKTNIAPFSFGLSFINQLRPISFAWKDGGMKDVGFGAEDVAAVNPLFVNYNPKGEVEGVKYDRLSAVFVNAFKEQQTQIETQRQQLERQQKQLEAQNRQIEALRQLVCAQNPTAAVCRQGDK